MASRSARPLNRTARDAEAGTEVGCASMGRCCTDQRLNLKRIPNNFGRMSSA